MAPKTSSPQVGNVIISEATKTQKVKTPVEKAAKAPKQVKEVKSPGQSVEGQAKKPRVKRTNSSNVEAVIQLVKDQKLEKAIVALEKLKDNMVTKKDRKPRAPTPFNRFVSEKMAQLKESGMTTNERMKECARLWKLSK